jgi:hypothetical protein
MQQKVDQNNTTKTGAESRPANARNLAPSWRRVPVGWIVAGLVVLSWVAFFLMTDGIALLIHR